MRQNVMLVALSALTVASAQMQNFTIDPNTVKPSVRSDWCNAQYNSCGKLCFSAPIANDCDTTTLSFNCTCSNGTAPGLQYYIQTMPSFICEQAFTDCIAANTASSRAQDECKSNIKSNCGTLDPADAKADEPEADKTTSAAPAPTKTGSGAEDSPNTSTSTAGAAATNMVLIGNGVAMVAAGVFAAML